ncbi:MULTISPECIES: site-specific DNA-methyltransferase [Geobacter]|uniref:site-specific DNA-methyltransferase n=1 Tax=Geobacter TaxID=28231 RepID=UPI00257220B3|nr:site-specific DNA-methyltransferase [Geobacter sulfurreducens]BEH11838.1 site-specific DNA-methyltransferase [Geobacter sulfurreducens subsp. ethanolicus]BET59701.1 site-specific DNA-methyltransferase [Geobacter sp. 60473]
MSKYDDLVAKLKEIFQIDRPELDFGVYRILNARAGEINDYLDNRLKARVQEALVNSGNANLEQARKELDEAEKNAQSLGMNPDDVPKVRELRQRIAEISAGSVEHENAVFSHLLTFFSRYYDSGDFISQRRYKGDTYAIPYAGEEVVLHWANKDQYYTKSGENFANYSFRLADGRTVHFRLVAADTAKDNRKDNDKERRFVLIERQTRVMTDDDGDEYEEELLPVEEANGELVLRFEYRPMPKGSKQDDLVGKAVQAILGNDTVTSSWLDLAKREPTEKNPQRTLLEKHLTTYTQKNSADYFIHKDLGGFLRRELDFYIKNEVMHLDDVQNAERFADIEKNLRMIQCLRAIALDMITFLAQLEDFQKKLWEKKKFVVAAHYCITLDRVIKDAPELLDTIAANERQWEQWDKLGMLEKGATRNGDYLKAHQFLMVDSFLFDGAFKDKLLATIDNLDESLDGLLVHGDNFQALNLLQERYREQVKCMYIDPPYNTSENAFLYKNQYKHSSWISLISNGAGLTPRLMASNGIIIGAIDDTEYSNFKYLLSDIFGAENYVGTIASEVNPAGQNIRPNVPARSHDYTHIFAKDIEAVDMVLRVLTKEEREQYKEKDDIGSYYWDNLRRRGGNSRPTDRHKQWFPLFVEGKRVRVPDMSWDEAQQKWIVLNLPSSGELEVWPIDPKGEKRIWRVNPDGARRGIDEGEISVIEKAGRKEVSKKSREPEGKKPKTLWAEPKYSATSHGSKLLLDILGQGLQFSYPKSIHLTTDSIRYWVELSSLVCDFFAGSGTTGHAVINLNREDSGQRKYILVEQGKYFDTVLKPRIQKVIYSADWKDGKAIAPETGISHAFKVLKIESYEDTLNNLELRRSAEQQSLLDGLSRDAKDDYLLRYMLDIESRGSLLSVNSFRNPFDCTLKVAVDSAGAWEERTIDLVETFNYLIGLKVKQIDSLRERGIVMVQGTLPTGEKTLVLWRDCEQVDYEALNRFCDSHAINPRDSEFEVVYINGDHNIPSVLTTTEEEGGITKALKLRQIEPEFLSRMFDGDV